MSEKEQWPKFWPKKCQCYMVGWEHLESVPHVCKTFVGMYLECDTCGHDIECHDNIGPLNLQKRISCDD